ncbi:MAG: hypothetical protein AB1638_08150 [Nitrospirota bacterium]
MADKIKRIINARVFILAILLLTLSSCASVRLKTEAARDAGVTGDFNLILYGGRYSDDLETLAILDVAGDGYEFVPYAPEFDYKIIKNVQAEEALRLAKSFVSFHRSYRYSLLSRILDPQGKAIGYELKPLYDPVAYGISDVLDINYWLQEGGKVKVTIRLLLPAERLRFPGGGDGSGGGGGGGA